MFKKIWWPGEGMVAASLVPVSVFFPLILIASFFGGYWAGIGLFVLALLLGGVVKVRGAMTRELDMEEAEEMKAHFGNRKRVVIYTGFMMIVSLAVAALVLPRILVPVLPMILPSFFLTLLSMTGLSPKTIAVAALIAFIPAGLTAGFAISWEMALFPMGVFLVLILPLSLAHAVRTHRLLKGDLERKYPPSITGASIVCK